MRPVRSILFPFDFSPASFAMIPYVVDMAERFRASTTILHAFDVAPDYVLESRLETTCDSGRTPIPYTPEFQAMRDERQARLDSFAQEQFANLDHVTVMEDGEPASAIESVARRQNMDLIMMPTRGLGRFRRFLLGSITAKVLHDAACPVFTSAHQPASTSANTTAYQSIVCAVDLAGETDAVVKAAAYIAQTYSARMCLVHVTSAYSPCDPGATESLSSSFHETATAGGRKAKAKVRILDGDIPDGIRTAAVEEGADLVVVGRGREHENLSRLWSHLYRIIRESPCPVLSV